MTTTAYQPVRHLDVGGRRIATDSEGYLIDRQLDPAIGQGSGKLAARFIASRQGKVVFDRELAAESTWESSFVGAIAIPMAIHEFNALFRKLVAKLIQQTQRGRVNRHGHGIARQD